MMLGRPRIKTTLVLLVCFICFVVFPTQYYWLNASPSSNKGVQALSLSELIRPLEKTCLFCADLFAKQCRQRFPTTLVPSDKKLKIAYFVASSPGNRKTRRSIRQTWGREVALRPVFLVGRTPNLLDMNLLQMEAKIFRDVIIEDFEDSKFNRTIKTAFILKNFMQRCLSANYLVKTDDMTFIQPHLLERILRDGNKNDLIGIVKTNSKPSRSLRSMDFVPYTIYKETYFPPYLFGNTFVIPRSRVSHILIHSMKIPMIAKDDVFFTGIVAKALNISLMNSPSFRAKPPLFEDNCVYRNYSVIQGVDNRLQELMWSKVKSIDLCDTYRKRFAIFINQYWP